MLEPCVWEGKKSVMGSFWNLICCWKLFLDLIQKGESRRNSEVSTESGMSLLIFEQCSLTVYSMFCWKLKLHCGTKMQIHVKSKSSHSVKEKSTSSLLTDNSHWFEFKLAWAGRPLNLWQIKIYKNKNKTLSKQSECCIQRKCNLLIINHTFSQNACPLP